MGWVVVAVSAAVLLRVAWVSYRSTLVDFEPWPGSALLQHPEQTGIEGLQPVSFETSTGVRIAGWYVPSLNGAAVIVTHGSNADRSTMLPELRYLAADGYGVLAFDWPGNGQSAGHVGWGLGEQQALTAAVDWVSARPEVAAAAIGALGFSCGGIVLTQVAATDTRIKAVVLEATPTSFVDYVHWERRRWGWVSEWPAMLALHRVGLQFDLPAPKQMISLIAPRPLLLIGGAQDEVVPPQMINELFAVAQEPKRLWLVPGANHGGYSLAQPAEYRKRLTRFFAGSLHPDERVRPLVATQQG